MAFGFVKDAWNSVTNKLGEAKDKAGDLLGLGAPDLSQYTQDVDAQRRMRDQFMREYGNTAAGQAPDIQLDRRAQTVNPVSVDPSTGMVGAVDRASASQAAQGDLGTFERPSASGYNANGYEAQGFDAASVAGGLQRRARQEGSLNLLQGAAEGKAPSVAENLLAKGINDAAQSQRSMAATARGSNVAMAMRNAARNQANLQQGVAGQTATLRAGEMATARGQYAGAVDSARGQDIGVETSNAGFQQDARKFNANAQNEAARFGAAARNDAAQFNTGAANTAALAGSAAANDFTKTRAQMQQQNNQFNAGQATGVSTFNAGQTNDVNNANAGRAVTVGTTNAGIANRGQEFNATAQNGRDVTRATMQQDNDQFNVGQRNADRAGVRSAAMGTAGQLDAATMAAIQAQEEAKKRRNEAIQNFLKGVGSTAAMGAGMGGAGGAGAAAGAI